MEPTGSALGRPPLSQLIRDHRDQIVVAWRAALHAAGAGSSRLPEPVRTDHLPALLVRIGELADDLARGQPPPGPPLAAADEHALQRFEQGVRLADVVREYGLLRDCLLEVLAGEAALGPEEARLINRAVDYALFASAARYETASDRLFRALDALTSDAAAGRSLDETLHALLRPLMSVSAAFDSCTILLREGDRLVVRAGVGLVDGSEIGSGLAWDEGIAGAIAQSGKPMLVRHAAADPRAVLPTFGTHAIRALYGVPLRAGDQVLGVAHVGSRTEYDFSDEEKLLFRTVAGRAAAHIFEVQLREREQAARARAEHEAALLESVLRASVDSIAVFDRDGRYLYASLSSARRHGLRPEEVRGRLVRELAPPLLDAGVLETVVRRVIERGAPEHFESAGGDARQLEYVVSPVIERNGTVASAVVVARDVTERRRQEEARQKSELRLLLALEAGGLGAWDYTPATRALRLDAQSHAILGTEQTTLDALWPRIHADDRVQIIPAIERAQATERGAFELELRVRRDDGGERWVAALGRVLRDAAGRPVSVIGTIQDITDRKRAQDRLSNGLRMAETFISVLGHDLRSPLSAIHMAAGLLARRGELAPGQARAAGRILTSAERMGRMISDLLDYSRVRAGLGLPLSPRRIDALEVCRTAVEELEVVYPRRTIFVEAEGDTAGEWDRDRVLQVVVNLTSNALRYGDPDTPVTLRLVGEPGEVRLEVHNQGAPIPAEIVPHLFDPSRKGQHIRTKADSIGLGLYIVHSIVRAHGGTIDVRSRAGEGTTFTVRLPRAPGRRQRARRRSGRGRTSR